MAYSIALTGSTVLVSRDLRRTISLAAFAAAAAAWADVALSTIAPSTFKFRHGHRCGKERQGKGIASSFQAGRVDRYVSALKATSGRMSTSLQQFSKKNLNKRKRQTVNSRTVQEKKHAQTYSSRYYCIYTAGFPPKPPPFSPSTPTCQAHLGVPLEHLDQLLVHDLVNDTSDFRVAEPVLRLPLELGFRHLNADHRCQALVGWSCERRSEPRR